METLYLSKENLEIIELSLVALRLCTVRLIKVLTLKIPNLKVILDRTPLTGILYSKALRNNFDLSDTEDFWKFKPLIHFFVETNFENTEPRFPKLDNEEYLWSSYPLYDSLEGLNEKVGLLVESLKENYEIKILRNEKFSTQSEIEEYNFKIIKESLDKILDK